MCGATYLAPWLNGVLGWQGLGTTELCGLKYLYTFKLCHMAEIWMPLKLFLLKIRSKVLIIFNHRLNLNLNIFEVILMGILR